jgi:hypothetical protein
MSDYENRHAPHAHEMPYQPSSAAGDSKVVVPGGLGEAALAL